VSQALTFRYYYDMFTVYFADGKVDRIVKHLDSHEVPIHILDLPESVQDYINNLKNGTKDD